MKDYGYTGIRLPKELKEAIKAVAKKERRSEAAQTVLFLEQAVAAHRRVFDEA